MGESSGEPQGATGAPPPPGELSPPRSSQALDQPTTGGTAGRRASDEEREAAVAVLNAAFASGRLSSDEHAARLERAINAETRIELVRLTADVSGPESRRPARRRRHRRSRWAVAVVAVVVAVVVTVVTAAVVLLAGGPAPHRPKVAARAVSVDNYCRRVMYAHAENPGLTFNAVTPSVPTGQTTLVADAPKSAQEDLQAWNSLQNATFVLQTFFEADPASQAAPRCLNAYDRYFTWAGSKGSSTRPGVISESVQPAYWLLAARSASGWCWYDLWVQDPTSRIVKKFALPKRFGITQPQVYAISDGRSCSANAAPGPGAWEPSPSPQEPLPFSLTRWIDLSNE